MVGVARAAGNLFIKGELDTSLIESGFKRVGSAFEKIGSFSKSINSDFVRLGGQAAKLAGIFSVFSGGVLAAFATIAKGSPQVAPALARMAAAFTRLQLIVGQALAPAFNKAAELFNLFVGYVSENQDTIAKWGNTAISIIEKVGGEIKKNIELFKKQNDLNQQFIQSQGQEGSGKFKLPPLATAGITGAGAVLGRGLGGIPGGVLGAAAGFAGSKAFEGFTEFGIRRDAGESVFSSFDQSVSTGNIGTDLIGGGVARGIGALIALLQEAFNGDKQVANRRDLAINQTSTYLD